eukprot:m.45554 g.45554  ORF g.45554 m.45554 type:complete len:682 (-) comp10263_c0_seq2:21-2066(-)
MLKSQRSVFKRRRPVANKIDKSHILGADLHNIPISTNNGVPSVLSLLINFIYKNISESSGVFRIPPPAGTVNELIESLAQHYPSDRPYALDDDPVANTIVVGSTLKTILRQTIDPVIPDGTLQELALLCSSLERSNTSMRKQVALSMKSALKVLSPISFNTLEAVIKLCHTLCENKKSSQWSADALSTVFGPCLYRTTNVLVQELAVFLVRSNKVIECLIDLYTDIFSEICIPPNNNPKHGVNIHIDESFSNDEHEDCNFVKFPDNTRYGHPTYEHTPEIELSPTSSVGASPFHGSRTQKHLAGHAIHRTVAKMLFGSWPGDNLPSVDIPHDLIPLPPTVSPLASPLASPLHSSSPARNSGSANLAKSPLNDGENANFSSQDQLFQEPKTPIAESRVTSRRGRAFSTNDADEMFARQEEERQFLAIVSPEVFRTSTTQTDKLLLSNPLMLAERLLEQLQQKGGRPHEIHHMTPAQLSEEKADLKKILRFYERRFEQLEGRPPSKEDKEHLRPLYQRHKQFKQAVSLDSIGSIARSTRRRRHMTSNQANENTSTTQSATVKRNDMGASDVFDLGVTGQENTAVLGSATKADTQGDINIGNPAIQIRIKLLKLKHEKKQLQRLLNKIKHKFEDENGRSMATREDRAPHEEMFQRYKLLKIQISDMEKTETQLPLPQHDLSQTL